MNGGMYDTEGRPIGYYVEDGERRHTLNRNEGAGNFHLMPNGVFLVRTDGRDMARMTRHDHRISCSRAIFVNHP